MSVINLTKLKGIVGKPPFLSGGGGGGNTNFFTHVVTAGEETANTVTLTAVFPPLTVGLTILVQRENGDVVNPGVDGITSITPIGADLVIVFDVFTVLEDDIILAMEGDTA